MTSSEITNNTTNVSKHYIGHLWAKRFSFDRSWSHDIIGTGLRNLSSVRDTKLSRPTTPRLTPWTPLRRSTTHQITLNRQYSSFEYKLWGRITRYGMKTIGIGLRTKKIASGDDVASTIIIMAQRIIDMTAPPEIKTAMHRFTHICKNESEIKASVDPSGR